MANVIFDEVKFSTSVRLEDVTMEQYNKIAAYINEIIGAAKAKQKSEHDTDQKEKYKRIGHYKGYEKVIAVFRDAEERPESYSWENLTTAVWKSMIPSLKEATLHGVSHTIGNLAAEGFTKKEVRYNQYLHLNENIYRLPVPAANAKEEAHTVSARNPEDVRLGAILRSARNKAGLSIAELGKSIGYDASIVLNWENGVYHMAETAMKALYEFFKKDIFSEKEEESA